MAEISDLFIQSTSGLPYKASCYGGEYCRMHGEHSLITGFFAAINSFKGEFQQESIDLIKFDQLTLVLEQLGEFMVIVAVDDFKNHERVRNLAKEILKEFYDRYGEVLTDNNYAKLSDFNEFDTWLDNKVGKVVGDLTKLIDQRKQGLLSKIKNRFKL